MTPLDPLAAQVPSHPDEGPGASPWWKMSALEGGEKKPKPGTHRRGLWWLLPSGPDQVHRSPIARAPEFCRDAPQGRPAVSWRRGRDSNPRYVLPHTRFPSVLLKPLGHLSVGVKTTTVSNHQQRQNFHGVKIFTASEKNCADTIERSWHPLTPRIFSQSDSNERAL